MIKDKLIKKSSLVLVNVGGKTVTKISQIIGANYVYVIKVLNNLEEDGFVERKKRIYFLTEKGKELAKHINNFIIDIEKVK